MNLVSAFGAAALPVAPVVLAGTGFDNPHFGTAFVANHVDL